MIEYIIRRTLAMIPVMFGILLLAFIVLYLIPGDPAATVAGPRASPEALKAIAGQMGLDRPVHERFFGYLNRILHGDLGVSAITGKPVLDSIKEKLPYTLKLAFLAMIGLLALIKE